MQAGAAAGDVENVELDPNMWREMDINNDGKLSKTEVRVFFLHLPKYEEAKAAVEAGGELPDPPASFIDEMFEKDDKDKDGFISWEEFSGPKGTEPPKEEL